MQEQFEDFSLSNMINDYLRKKGAVSDRDNTHIHPSEFHGCKRRIAYAYYQATGLIKVRDGAVKVDARLQRVFGNGHHVHDRFKSYLADPEFCGGTLLGWWQCRNWWHHLQKGDHPRIFGTEEKIGIPLPKEPCECGCDKFEYVEVGVFDPEINMGGHVDTILLVKEPVIVDYKSAMSRSFEKVISDPKPEHTTQMQLYLMMTGCRLGKFLYENKDTQTLKEINVVRDDDYVSYLRRRARTLTWMIKHPTSPGTVQLPPRSSSLNPKSDPYPKLVINYKKTSRDCIECRFRKHCWNLK